MRVLGIETSCDETAAAVVAGAGLVLSNVIHSQVALHAAYGGVVPELASRDHLRHGVPVVREALARAGLSFAELDGIAVTCRPGLAGALLVGTQLAHGLAWATGLPLVGVDHLVGHLSAAYLDFSQVGGRAPERAPELPFIGLIASGGHTSIYRVDSLEPEGTREIGGTRDDAAGEAYDKVAKLLGLGYPGGPVIDRLAAEGDARAISLAKPMPQRASLEFSFSGLKTQVARWVDEHGRPGDDATLRDLCAAFQARVVDSLLSKTFRAAQREQVSCVVLGGGVAANRELRSRAERLARERGVHLTLPPLEACTDNAAMIALAGVAPLRRGEDHRGALQVSTQSSLPRVTRKGRGIRRG
ncbi:MAG: tRNA (adenosine(37)-N6)-threonylcarbamoyltransferase complex transferase subunit TsaD [Polyangiaceae bacterium]|nr:tRNA (adenosine(37)-N6)-threonylcarbamoyltransferase complex transferase subunit TsaD [Polyangiaceae bacterium]MCW5792279.1 tRNA (adenosine(37)-N6)-threonylcarbamoyltransferase complex transferase subunit TsaD [Polyangiaceae bacterium]